MTSIIFMLDVLIHDLHKGGFPKSPLEFRVWISNHISHATVDVITYPCPKPS